MGEVDVSDVEVGQVWVLEDMPPEEPDPWVYLVLELRPSDMLTMRLYHPDPAAIGELCDIGYHQLEADNGVMRWRRLA